MTIEQKAREIADKLSWSKRTYTPQQLARLGIIEGLEMAAKWHDEQAEHWRKKALEVSDYALQCRKYYSHMQSHENAATAIRALIEEQKV